MSGGPRVAPAGGEQSRAESLTLVGRCGGITQACQYTSPTVLRGFFLLGGLAGYLDVPRRPATCGVSKNLRQRSQADTDSWHGLFDTQADPVEGVFSLSHKRADTVGHPISTQHGYCYYVGFARFLGLQRQHMRGTIFGMWGMTNSIRAFFAWWMENKEREKGGDSLRFVGWDFALSVFCEITTVS